MVLIAYTGYMLKKLLITIFTSILLTFLHVSPAKASEEFQIDASVTYEVQETGITHVTHEITLTNLFSKLYATSYTLNLSNIEPENVSVTENGSKLPASVVNNNGTTSIRVVFEEGVVGLDESRTFSVEFDESSFATRTGEVWEIAVPRLSNPESFDRYNTRLLVPARLGQEAYISPTPTINTSTQNHLVYTFTKEQVAASGISAGFGDFQVFSFTLNYHLENPLSRSAEVEIALPPDTSFQKVYYQRIEPAPKEVVLDADGNWLATYELEKRERVDVVASGSVQIFSKPRQLYTPSDENLENNLKSTEYWQVDDPAIVNLARQLKTPRAIYDYVSSTLTYNYDRVEPNVDRLGAKGALQSPSIAICMEYTDLFVALARAAGIPAREVNGYAYTENPEIQPLSLVADVLHSWPEYWDEDRGVWIPVDPTWASTTGGVDFFNKLDLRHFAFVLHGESATKPFPPGSYKLGPNPQKDVFVSFGQLPEEKQSIPNVVASTKNSFPFTSSKIEVSIENPGPVALYNIEPEIYFEDDLANKANINHLLPYSTETVEVAVPFSFLGIKTPDSVKVLVAGESVTVPTFKSQVIIYNLLALFVLLGLVVIMFYLRVKKVNLRSILRRKNEEPETQNEIQSGS